MLAWLRRQVPVPGEQRARTSRKVLLALPVAVALLLAAYFLLPRGHRGMCVPLDGVARMYVGEKAIQMVKSIHWHPKAIKDIVNATVVFYKDGSVLWETQSRNWREAQELLAEMIRAIKLNQGELPYLIPVRHEINGTVVYFIADVRGPVHALFRKGNLLIWLEMGLNGTKYLKELLRCK